MNPSISNYDTISSLSEYTRQLDISHPKLFLKSVIKSGDNNLIVNSTSLSNKYYDYIIKTVMTLELTNTEYMRYRYQPKLFCYETYGTVELWSLLLKINNITSVSEFNNKKIKVFSASIFNVLNEILVNEDKNILENNDSIGY